ncbi:MAG: L,D-transpeptidase [Bacteroidales bacterium]|nr:L,D-transpeptidase [Bacteroidales bacterium]
MNKIKNLVLVALVCAAAVSCSEASKKKLGGWLHLDPLRDTVTVVRDSFVVKDIDAGFLVVSKQDMTVTLYGVDGSVKMSYPIACGAAYGNKGGEDDMRTPEGFFHVGIVANSTNWPYKNKKTGAIAMGCYGPKYIGLKEKPDIGIHGTNSPHSIGHRASHGCIRVNSENILILAQHVYPGMPVIITPSSRDAVVNYPVSPR